MRQVICVLALTLCLFGPAHGGKKRPVQKKAPPAPDSYAPSSSLEEEMIRYLGVRYRRGGRSPRGLDCSGYVGLVYRNALGVELPHQSASIYLSSGFYRVPLEGLRTGDLVFFTPSRKSKRISHVGIYLSDGNFVHAARRNGVMISSLGDRYWSARVIGAKRMESMKKEEWPKPENPAWEISFTSDHQPLVFALTTHLNDVSSSDELNPADARWAHHSFSLELDYGKALPGRSGNLFRLSLFQDSLFSWRQGEAHRPLSGIGEAPLGGNRPSLALARGFRIGSDIRPFEWLSITPSFSYYDYEGYLDEAGLPRHSIGLDMAFGSIADGWSVSTGFRYSSLISAREVAEEEDLPAALDMSLAFSQKLSDNLMISLIGERYQRSGSVALEHSTAVERESEEQRFSVLFNFSY
ncbi:MAG: C40 family peptidase [Deltaproteobacteria bacterium]|nr:C40 family peptidase [Deltaproteobacteria bacterium]